MTGRRPDRDEIRDEEDYSAQLPFFGKDEMNLAEFPVALLRRQSDSRTSFSYEGYVKGPDGLRHKQKWTVHGLSGTGLPNEYDERVLIALMAVSAGDGFRSRKVPFSVYRILKIMGLTDSVRDYRNIERSLERLTGVTIIAEGAFWDNGAKGFIKHKSAFHIIERFWLAYKEEDDSIREAEGVQAYFIWSDDLWQSIKDGYIKTLDLSFYYSLKTPLARRLYRFLDKRLHKHPHFEIDIFELAGRLGMATYK
jgi:plasmid replication initiation protein